MKRYILTALAATTLTAAAQTINFDTDDFGSIGVYDAWEASPFRTGQLKGNAAVVANPCTATDPVLGYAPNTSARVLAVQRSRFGSNTFGVRIDLKEPFRLTKQTRYLHVMTYLADKPAPSRLMAIGLGRRVEDEWSWQTGQDEQFWALSTSDVEPSAQWQDVVLGFKGFSYATDQEPAKGIDIYSLVLVPDVRSPHADAADFACYFDQLLIDSNPARRFSSERYPVNFDRAQTPTRTDRHLDKVGLSNSNAGTTQEAGGLAGLIYNDKTQSAVFSAKPGHTVRPTFGYTGVWMSAYVYVDWGNDGTFSYDLAADMKPAQGSDLVSYNAYMPEATWYKSDGTTVNNGNQIANGVPSFTVPAATAPGFYRMRYKVDWNNIDPGGNTSEANHIVSNGGGITDVLLDVHTDVVRVSDQQLNGAVLTADGQELNNFEAPYGQPFAIKMQPAPGFGYKGITVRYGYRLEGEAVVGDNPQYLTATFTAADFDDNDCLTLPASIMVGGTMQIEGLFTEDARKPLKGDTISNLGQLSNAKAYLIHALSQEGYLVWNTSVSDRYVSLRGVTNTSYQGLPSDARVATIYQQRIDPFDASTSWQILQKDGNYYLRNVGNSLYVTLSDRDYVFTDAATPLAQIRANAAGETIDGSTTSLAGTFSILGAGGDDKHYACICTGTTPQGVRNWTFNDHGSPFYITENPNLSVTDPFLADGIRPATALIPHDNATYLLTGQRISRPVHKGLYIRQGRLFMKK